MHNTFNSEPMARVLSLVPDAKPHGHGWRARCPAHNGESSTSLSITQGDDGRVLLKCFGGCVLPTIVAALGIKESDLFEPTERERTTPRPKPVKEVRSFASANEAAKAYAMTHGRWDSLWTYCDAGGAPVGLVLRWNAEGGERTSAPYGGSVTTGDCHYPRSGARSTDSIASQPMPARACVLPRARSAQTNSQHSASSRPPARAAHRAQRKPTGRRSLGGK